jgi:hypothetical protein
MGEWRCSFNIIYLALQYIRLINSNHVCINLYVTVFYIDLLNFTDIVNAAIHKYSHSQYLYHVITVLYCSLLPQI